MTMIKKIIDIQRLIAATIIVIVGIVIVSLIAIILNYFGASGFVTLVFLTLVSVVYWVMGDTN